MEKHVVEKQDGVNINYNEIIFSKNWEKYRTEEYFKYRKNWSEYPKSKMVSNAPLHLDIETTTGCNLKCPMCARTLMEEKGQISQCFIKKDEYKKIIDEAVEIGVKSIKLNYLGEPLVHKDIVFQVEYAKKKGIVDVMFNTNAVLLTKELSKKLLEAGLDKIFISFDAVNPKLYEQQRVGARLGKVIDNVYEFVKLRDQYSPKTMIRLSMVMYEGEVWQKQFEAMKIMWNGLVDAIGYGLFNQRGEDKEEFEKVDGFVCEQLFQRMFLKCNGDVTVCCVDEFNKLKIGNWREMSLYDLWNSEKYQKIRNDHIQGNYYKYETCKKCFLPKVYENMQKGK